MQNYKSLTRQQRTELIVSLGEKPYREKQIHLWICRGAESFADMTDLPGPFREKLSRACAFERAKVARRQLSEDGTRKFLLELSDGAMVEAVFMKYEYGNSVCLSTQAGCAMGCRFCASAIGGKQRDLAAWEILDEYFVCRRECGEDIGHIVLMGTGEPFDNYDQVSAFIDMAADPDGPKIGSRSITVSTCGLVPGIRRFGQDHPQVNLAVSLHAATQEERLAIMPVAKAYPLPELIGACRQHAELTGRRITFEYTLIEGVNDTRDHAEKLAALLKGMLCHVNLIPLNPVAETGMRGAGRKAAQAFAASLRSMGIPATVRRQLGSDIDAACGQLRRRCESK